MRFVNRQYYLVTNEIVEDGISYEIPYGHDECDIAFDISVLNPVRGSYVVIDEIYAPHEAEARLRCDHYLTEKIDDIVEENQPRTLRFTPRK